MLDGVTQCWWLSKTCEVNWGAWAVVVAVAALWIAVYTAVVTAASAAAVFWLGFKANAVANATYDIERQSRQREGHFLLIYLRGEILVARATVTGWLRVMGGSLGGMYFTFKEAERRALFSSLIELELPLARERFERLHVLDPGVGDALARALGMLGVLKVSYKPILRMEDGPDAQESLDGLIHRHRELLADLEKVEAAARAAHDADNR